MSPPKPNAKRESTMTATAATTTTMMTTATTTTNNMCPPPLKINRDSHSIKKTSPPSSSASSASSAPSRPRQPVIIYTHPPQVIHTSPKDFMALVQKLTGMPPSRGESSTAATTSGATNNRSAKPEKLEGNVSHGKSRNGDDKIGAVGGNAGVNNKNISEDSEASSVITMEGNIRELQGHVNSCPFVSMPPPPPPPSAAPMFDSPASHHPYYSDIGPVFGSEHMLYSNQPGLNFEPDPLFFSPNLRSSYFSSSGFDAMPEFRDF